ncbi:quinon protein alcohol dehydrogenase-like superfamily [Peziza echinospora]|nr:quinon protein alcohol dehydrogenase-like superfamily [Peziza echinospora]
MQAADGSIPTIAVSAGFPSDTTESVSKDVAPFLTKHIPEQYASAPPQEDSQQGNTRYCYRHRPDVKCRRQADEITMDSLQKQLEKLPQEEQQTITHIWNLFSAAPATHRTIMLQGILTQCCFPQLSFISAALRDLIRIDFLTALPPELSFKILCYLDTTSLCKAAQVSQRWRILADDDVVWHKMCEQHIDRKCDKCGWGLPLLERKRLRASKRQIQLRATGLTSEILDQTTNSTSKLNIHGKRTGTSTDGDEGPASQVKRSCHGDGIASSSSHFPKRRPWKDVYSERYKVESNWRRGRCTTKIFKGHTNGIICLQFDDTILATGSYDTTIKIWDLESGEETRTLSGHTLGVRCLQFDDRMLISGSLDKTIKIWNYRTGDCLSTLQGHTGGVISLHFDSNLLVSGSVDKTIRVWNFTDKSCVTLRGHTDWVNSVKIHSPSRTVFSASDDMTVKIWNLDTMACVTTLNGHCGQVQQVLPIELSGFDVGLLNPEDKSSEGDLSEGSSSSVVPPPPVSPLASPPTPYTLTSPPLQNSHLLSPPHYSTSSASSSSAAPPPATTHREPMPHYILTAALDSTVKLWDLTTGKCVKTLFGHLEGIWALAADNLRVVSGAQDRMVKVWDVRTGKCERTVTGHAAAVSCLALSDSRLITGSEDCEARMYCFKMDFGDSGEGSASGYNGGVETPPEYMGDAPEASEVSHFHHDHHHHHHHGEGMEEDGEDGYAS